ncbi:alpha/beta fold hydrolase [Candidatus Woesearchaeota archaeon]|nr:alpha/beta fold hydrolase [Candidatus Woesearchaeota archaeon]
MKQKLTFNNSKGQKLVGILSNPTDDRKKPMIILCHGFSSSKDAPTYTKLETMFNEKSISTFRFDFFGHGESQGKFEDITISEAVDDILNAIDFLKKQGYSKFGLIGSSFGGMASILTASKSNDLFVLGLRAPVSDYLGKIVAQITNTEINDWKKKGYTYYISSKQGKMRLNYSFFEDSENVDGYKAAEKIDIPTIIVHGDADVNVPLEQSKKTARIIPDCKLEIIKGAGHHFSNPAEAEKAVELIFDFIVKHSK